MTGLHVKIRYFLTVGLYRTIVRSQSTSLRGKLEGAAPLVPDPRCANSTGYAEREGGALAAL